MKPRFGSKLRLTLHTNGLLLGDLPDDILADLDLIILSFNYEKITHHGLAQGYYGKIIRNVLKIRSKSDVTIMGRLTITEKTSLYAAKKLTEEFWDQMYFQLENCLQFEDFEAYYQNYTFDVALLYRDWINKLDRL